MFVLVCIGHLRVPRHATPLTRPPIELSMNTLGARIASNSVHIYNLSISTVGASTTSNSVHIYNPNFPLAFTNSVSEMSPVDALCNSSTTIQNCNMLPINELAFGYTSW
jgi:hypothetical protein